MMFHNLIAQPANNIVSVENPVAISVPNGTAFGSITFQGFISATLANGFVKGIAVTYSAGSYNSAVNGSYTLTGTLTMSGTTTNPLGLTASIVVWVLPIAHIWHDFIDRSKATFGTDNIQRIETDVAGKAGLSLNRISGVLLRTPSWNGEGTYFNSQTGLKWSGSNTSLKPYSDGTQFTMYFIFKQLTVTSTYNAPIWDTTNFSSASIGCSLWVDNRSSLSKSNRVKFLISRNVSGTPAINMESGDNAIVQNAWNCIKITYDGTTVRLYTSASGGSFTQVASSTVAAAFSASNPSNIYTWGNQTTFGTQTGSTIYMKHAYLLNSLSGNQTLLDSWAQAMCQENIIVYDANIYLRIGQSNQAGRGLNSGIASELSSTVGARIMVAQPTPPTQTDATGTINSDSYWEVLQLARNQTIENVATQHGMEMRFGYDMWQFNENCWIIKLGVGGTPIYSTATYNDWNVSSAQLYTLTLNLSSVAVDELRHVFRRNPVVRGMSIMQGETDAIITGAGAQFKSNWTTWINTFIPALESAQGITINKLRIFFWQITNVGGAAYDPTEFAAVKAAQVDLGTNYLTDNPSMSTKILGVTTRTTDDIPLLDLQHYSETGLATMAGYEVDYFKAYTKE
jgi:carbohydrate esterase-like sialic acid-specific acetylesterase